MLLHEYHLIFLRLLYKIKDDQRIPKTTVDNREIIQALPSLSRV